MSPSTAVSPPPASTQYSSERLTKLSLVAVAALWVLPFVLPLAQPPLKHFHAEWLAAMLGVLAFAALAVSRRARLTLPLVAVPMVLLAVYCAVQPLFVPMVYSEPSQGYALYLLWAAAMMVVGATLRSELGTERLLCAIAWGALIGGVISALLGIIQKYGPAEWMFLLQFDHMQQKPAQGNVGHQSYFADHALFAVIGTAFLYGRGRLATLAAIVAMAVLATAIALAASRGTAVALLAVVVLAGLTAGWRRSGESVRVFGATIIAAVCLAAVTPVIPKIERALHESNPATQWKTTLAERALDNPDSGGTATRKELWVAGWKAVLSRPGFGYGPDAFAPALFENHVDRPLLGYTTHSHNLFLETQLAFGTVGTMLLVIMIGYLVWQYRRRFLDPAWSLVTAMALVIALRSMLDLPLWFAHFLGIAAVLAGAADARVHTLAVTKGSLRIASLAIPVTGAVFLSATLTLYLGLSEISREPLLLRDMEQRIMAAQRLPFFTALGDSMRTHLPPLHPDIAERNLEVNTRSMHWRPNPKVVYRQVALLALTGREREACHLLERAHAVFHPNTGAWLQQLLAQQRGVRNQRLKRIGAAHARLRAGEPPDCAVTSAHAASARQ